MRRFVQGFAACYLATAILFGVSMKATLPAINVAGAAYYGAVWPAWPLSELFNRVLVPIPAWAFTFEKESSK